MNKLRLLIVDDEPLIRKGIRKAASAIAEVDVVGECGSGAEAIQRIASDRPDLVFLDVQMPDCSGIDVVRNIGPDQMPAVVFVTAYDEYAVKAFELNAVDYLLKPFDEQRLREAVQRAQLRRSQNDGGLLVEKLQQLLSPSGRKWPERLVIRNGDRYDFVSVESIDWVESANNYVELHCGPKQYLMGETLTNLEASLDPERFRRIHRCRIVNITRVAAIHPLLGGAYQLEMQSGIRLTSGRQYKEVVQQLLRSEAGIGR